MKNYLTPKEKTEFQIEVEKSKFIGILLPFNNKNNLQDELSKIKQDYPKARHYCYAYKINEESKFSDDGEPSGTAGKPILNQIEQANLTNCLLVVVRYFGGTLLGSGRLLRTYLESAKQIVERSSKFELITSQKWRIFVEIENFDYVKNYILRNNFFIINTMFNDKICIDFAVPREAKESIEEDLYGKIEVVGKIDYLYRREV